jgi:hypothetical protein
MGVARWLGALLNYYLFVWLIAKPKAKAISKSNSTNSKSGLSFSCALVVNGRSYLVGILGVVKVGYLRSIFPVSVTATFLY